MIYKYIPTQAEKKLLIVLVNPEFFGKTIKLICEQAGVTPRTYYKAMEKDGFVELVNETQIEMVKREIGLVLRATLKYSLKERGHQDRKMLLGMFGLTDDMHKHLTRKVAAEATLAEKKAEIFTGNSAENALMQALVDLLDEEDE
jgi:hypothetical protein